MVWTFADVQHRFNETPRKAREAHLTVDRGGKMVDVTMALPPQWWWSETKFRQSSVEPRFYFDDRPLTFAVLWPHARPWHLSRPQPMLRCIPDAQSVAQMLAAGLAATAGQRESSAIQAATIGRPVHTGTLAAAS